jgi:hypothetical protein
MTNNNTLSERHVSFLITKGEVSGSALFKHFFQISKGLFKCLAMDCKVIHIDLGAFMD